MWSRMLRFSVSILLPVVFLYLFFRGIDLGKLEESLGNVGAGWWLLTLAAFVQVLHCILRAARWRILLGPLKKDVGYYNLISTISIGYMVTMLLPGRLGEVLRPVLLAGREKISKGGAIATILLERLMDALTVASLFAIYLIFFLGPPGGKGREAAAGMSVGWGVVMGLFIVLSFPFLYLVVHFRARVAALLQRVVREESRAGAAIHKVRRARAPCRLVLLLPHLGGHRLLHLVFSPSLRHPDPALGLPPHARSAHLRHRHSHAGRRGNVRVVRAAGALPVLRRGPFLGGGGDPRDACLRGRPRHHHGIRLPLERWVELLRAHGAGPHG